MDDDLDAHAFTDVAPWLGSLAVFLLVLPLLGSSLTSPILSRLQRSGAAEHAAAPSCTPCTLIDPMDGVGAWHIVTGGGARASLRAVSTARGKALELEYDLGTRRGAWVQLRRDYAQPLDLGGCDHLRFYHQDTRANTLEVGLTSASGQNYFFAQPWHAATRVPWWTRATFDLGGFRLGRQAIPNRRKVAAIFISVTNSAQNGDVGGRGRLRVDDLQALNLAGRPVPAGFAPVAGNPSSVRRAAAWIGAQQRPGGLLKSWQEEPAANAWLYDQALGLLVLSATDPARAARLVRALLQLQNPDGSWYEGYNYHPSGDVFGLSQNAGMGWEPARLRQKEFLILSTQGGIRASDGRPIALGYHTGHWQLHVHGMADQPGSGCIRRARLRRVGRHARNLCLLGPGGAGAGHHLRFL